LRATTFAKQGKSFAINRAGDMTERVLELFRADLFLSEPFVRRCCSPAAKHSCSAGFTRRRWLLAIPGG